MLQPRQQAEQPVIWRTAYCHMVAEYKRTSGFTGFHVETCTPSDIVTARCQSQTPCSSAMMTRRTVTLNFCILTIQSCASNCINQGPSSNRLHVHLPWGPGVNTPGCQEVPFWLFIKKKEDPVQPQVPESSPLVS